MNAMKPIEMTECKTKRPISVVRECGICADIRRDDVRFVQNRSMSCISMVLSDIELDKLFNIENCMHLCNDFDQISLFLIIFFSFLRMKFVVVAYPSLCVIVGIMAITQAITWNMSNPLNQEMIWKRLPQYAMNSAETPCIMPYTTISHSVKCTNTPHI